MERQKSNRTIWIILIVILVLACCCVLGAAGTFLIVTERTVGLRLPELGTPESTIGRISDSSERTFEVGAGPLLQVDDFAGAVHVTAGEPGVIHVVATRNAPGQGDLDSMRVEYTELDNGVQIVASLSNARAINRSVDLDIEVPADARIVVDSGAGQIVVDGVSGELDLHTGAGEVVATDVTGGGRLDTGAGAVRYEGEPAADLDLQAGTGEVVIALPSGASYNLDLGTGMGEVEIDDFDVAGDVSPRSVQGTIGRGGPTIRAHTGLGRVALHVLE